MINEKPFRPDDFLFGMKRFPYILFLGSSFEIDEFDNKKILDLPWSCVITSLIDENALNDALDNKERKTRNIFAKTASDANEQGDVSRSENFSDRHNLKIIRLFNDEEKISSRGAQVNAKEGFSHVVQSVGAQSVRLVIVGYRKNDHFSLGRMMDCFLEKNSLKGVKTFIFDMDAQDDFLKFFKENEENYSTVAIYSNSLSELLGDFLDEQFDDEGNFSEASADDYIFYVKGKIKSLDKEKHLNEYRFLNLLHEEEMENIVPSYMLENWFYAFLKQSPYEPQWYTVITSKINSVWNAT